MKRSNNVAFYLLFGVLTVLFLVAFLRYGISNNQEFSTEIVLPEFSVAALEGERIFSENCTSCHGTNADGTDRGPPLLHNIYNPGHHADGAFYRAVARGTVQHHWPFGDMPAQPHVSNAEVAKIIVYVRELQIANGIVYQSHSM